MDENLIRDKFIKGYDCSQVVLAYFAERLGITEEMANKVTACFGGGMGQGFTWLDAGTHESLTDATNFVKTVETHQHRKIGCLEEIAYLNGWISREVLLELCENYKQNQYGQYLKDVIDGKFRENLS